MSSESLAAAVWSQTWQIAAVVLVVVGTTRLLDVRRPHLALLLWTLVFVKCLTPPAWSCPVGLFSWLQFRVQDPASVSTVDESAAAFPEVRATLASGATDATEFVAGDRRWAFAAETLLVVWIAGSLGTAGLVFVLWRRCLRRIRDSRVAYDPQLAARVDELGRRLGLGRNVELVVCRGALGPAVIGVLRPQLILPQRLVSGRVFDQFEAIVAHELVHVRRRDTALLLVELAAKVLWWFHPLVWMASRQASRWRECCCDAETVARLGCSPASYARGLLDVLEHLQVDRSLTLAPGMCPAEITRRRLETIMRESHTFQKNTPRYAWLLAALAGLILLPGSPLILRTQGNPNELADAAAIEQKLNELERGCIQASLSAEETKAALDVSKRVNADKYELCKLAACGKLSAIEKSAFDKLVARFGHPLDKDLAKLREVTAQAGLTAAETALAERVALQEGFDNKAILRRYEIGKMSAEEKAAFEKILALQGHPHADGIARLTEAARQAGLSDSQLQTLRGLAARADWDLQRIKEWKRTGQISDAETAALGKLQPFVEHLQSTPNAGEAEKVRVFRQVCQVAGLSDAETEALFEAVKQAGGDEQGLLQAKQAGQLAESAAAGLKKLESLLGKLEDFVDSPHKKEIGKLLEMAALAGLSTEETGVLMKLAAKANHDRETVKQMHDSGGLIDAEVRVVEKVLASQGR